MTRPCWGPVLITRVVHLGSKKRSGERQSPEESILRDFGIFQGKLHYNYALFVQKPFYTHLAGEQELAQFSGGGLIQVNL